MNIPRHDEFIERFADPVWLVIATQICKRHGIEPRGLLRAEHGESVVVLVDDRFVLKLYRPWKTGFRRETFALDLVAGKLPFRTPDLVAAGEFEGYDYTVTTRIPGRLLTRAEWLTVGLGDQLGLLAHLADALKVLHSLNSEAVEFDWPGFICKQAAGAVERQSSEGGNPEWVERLPTYIEESLTLIDLDGTQPFLHGDVHFGNIRIADRSAGPGITGIFDFADSLRGHHEYEFVAIGVLMVQGQGDLQREFFRRYGYADADINEELRRRLMLLTIFYEWSSLRRYAERLGVDPMDYSLDELERAIWNFV